MEPKERQVPRIVIVGGGVAGLMLATRLGHVLSRRGLAPSHLDRPKLDPCVEADAAYLRCRHLECLRAAGADTWRTHEPIMFEYVPGQLDAIDRTATRIRLAPMQRAGEMIADARELDYDVLVLAFGSRANDFGTPGVVEHCHFIDSHDQADTFNARLRAHIARSLAQGSNIDIAIVGGGATGVELVAELTRMVEFAAATAKPTCAGGCA